MEAGKCVRRVSSAGKPWGEKITQKLVCHVVKELAALSKQHAARMRVSRAIEMGRIAYFLPERCIRKRDRPMSAAAPLTSRSKVVGSGVVVATNVASVVGGKVMFEVKLNRPSVV